MTMTSGLSLACVGIANDHFEFALDAVKQLAVGLAEGLDAFAFELSGHC